MLFLMQWTINSGALPEAVRKFLAGEGMAGLDAPGTKLVARYHTPGSGKGWLIVETDNVESLYHHATHWGEIITWETHPVLEDEAAAKVCAVVHGSKTDHTVLADFHLKEGLMDEFIEWLSGENGIRITRGFDGCLELVVYKDQSNANRLFIYERWVSKKHYDAYIFLF